MKCKASLLERKNIQTYFMEPLFVFLKKPVNSQSCDVKKLQLFSKACPLHKLPQQLFGLSVKMLDSFVVRSFLLLISVHVVTLEVNVLHHHFAIWFIFAQSVMYVRCHLLVQLVN